MKIAVGGFQHETNTFAPGLAAYENFVQPTSWPGLLAGEAIFDGVAGANLPIAGFIQAAARSGHMLVPLLWTNAPPSGPVSDQAFERIMARMLAALAEAGPFDAVYLDLHGAMVTESHDDGEGEILRRVRAVVGPEVRIAASLDLHANITAGMVAHADILTAYRTYPHIDMAETGARAAALLTGPRRPAKSLRHTPFLLPITAQCTLVEPCRGLYAELERIEAETGASLSFTPGFPPADIADCGPAVFAYAVDQSTADRAADALMAAILAAEAAFAADRIWTPEAAIAEAARLAEGANRPVVLADTQDNPGAGGPSDTVGLLEALIAAGAERSVIGIIQDPETVAAAHKAGVGAEITVSLGGKSLPGDRPLRATARVERLGDGNFDGSGAMYAGSRFELGPMALLEIGGVKVVVGERRQQAASRSIFEHLGVEPLEQKIVAVKSSVHFRADFQPIAEAVLVVAAPGINLADPADFPYAKLRPGVRKRPQA